MISIGAEQRQGRKICCWSKNTETKLLFPYLSSLSLKHSKQVRNVGIILDSDLRFDDHISTVTRTALYHLKYV